MLIHCFLTVTLTFGLLVCPYFSFSSETDNQSELNLEEVIQHIQTKEESLDTFVAKFVQVKRSRLLKEPLYSQGLIYFDRQGKILWKTTKPFPLVVLIIDDSLYLDYPDMAKTKRRNVARSVKPLKKYFGFGQSIEQLRQLYEMGLSHETNPNTISLRLVPKSKAISKRIETIEVVINTKNWLPEQVCFKEAKGGYTLLTLYFTLMNAGLPEGIFSLPSAEGQRSEPEVSNGKGGGE